MQCSIDLLKVEDAVKDTFEHPLCHSHWKGRAAMSAAEAGPLTAPCLRPLSTIMAEGRECCDPGSANVRLRTMVSHRVRQLVRRQSRVLRALRGVEVRNLGCRMSTKGGRARVKICQSIGRVTCGNRAMDSDGDFKLDETSGIGDKARTPGV